MGWAWAGGARGRRQGLRPPWSAHVFIPEGQRVNDSVEPVGEAADEACFTPARFWQALNSRRAHVHGVRRVQSARRGPPVESPARMRLHGSPAHPGSARRTTRRPKVEANHGVTVFFQFPFACFRLAPRMRNLSEPNSEYSSIYRYETALVMRAVSFCADAVPHPRRRLWFVACAAGAMRLSSGRSHRVSLN